MKGKKIPLHPVPLPVCSQFDPDDVPVLGFLSGSAVVAEPAPIRHSDIQAVRVKSCRAGLTAQQLSPCNTRTPLDAYLQIQLHFIYVLPVHSSGLKVQ